MHITSVGKIAFCGSLSKSNDRSAAKCDSSLNDDTEDILYQAFQHAPQNYLRKKENLNTPAHHDREPFGVVITPSNKRDLRLYKTAERLARTVKSMTPKVILYLHSPKSTTSANATFGHDNRTARHSYRIFAKLILMENGPNADIEVAFVDGVTFQLRQMEQAKAKMIVCWKDNFVPRESIFRVDSNMILTCELKDLVLCSDDLLPETWALVETLSHHFRVVQSASKACIGIEKHHDQKPINDQKYPVSLKMVTAVWDKSQWVVLEGVLD
jgi:hypothetical protein